MVWLVSKLILKCINFSIACLCLALYCVCVGFLCFNHTRLGGICGRSLVMYLWSCYTATRPTKSPTDWYPIPNSLLIYTSSLSLTSNVLPLTKGILPQGLRMALDHFSSVEAQNNVQNYIKKEFIAKGFGLGRENI